MRTWIAGLVLTLVAVLGLTPAAEAAPGCVVNVAGVKVCGELVGQPLPEVVTVTVRPDPIVRPGPTVTVPGPTRTVTVTEVEPGDTVTVTERPAPSAGPTSAPRTSVPTQTVTETLVPDGGGQTTPPSATMEDDKPLVDIPDIDSPAGAVGIGLLSLVAILLITMFGMWLGYYMGRKRKEEEDTSFMRALLDESKIHRRRH